MASADLRKQLECSICLSVYTDPATLKCGHNFCRVCIDHVLDSQEGSGGYSCPECRKEFMERPALQRNITLCNIAENFLSTQSDQEETGILCTYCVDSLVPAVKSCLLCEAYLCDKHLRVHSKAPEHVLCDPTSPQESRKCSVHKKILEYYCIDDATSVCVSCYVIGEHKGHQMESLDEATEKKKKQLRNVLQKLMTQRENMEKRVQSLQKSRRNVHQKAEVESERISTLFRNLWRQLEDLEKRVLKDITRQAERLSTSYDEMTWQLEIKKEELSRKILHIEELCNMTDPMTVLQEPDLCGTEEGDNEDRERRDAQLHDGRDLDFVAISHTLQKGLSDIITGVHGGICIPEAEDLILDLNTANYDLFISRDRKTAWRSSDQNHPETLERFQYAYQVLSTQSFSSGRHYWEVDVGESWSCRFGMCYPSIDRGGDLSQIGYNKKSWCLEKYNNQYSAIHDNLKKRLPHNITSNRVRIYLDYKAGQISFYDLCHPLRHLHTFTATFTEPLHAVLWVRDGCVKVCGGHHRRSDQNVRHPPTDK